jgi:hypothetical protein
MKKKDEGALRPESFGLKSFIQEKPPEVDPTAEETILAAGADKVFWKTLHKHFDNSIQQLEQINEQAIANGMPFDEIGRNALVISQVKGVLRKIINGVEDAREARDGKQT